MNYNEWLLSQPISLQQEILGPGKWKLWSENKLTVSDLVDNSGKPFTIKELSEKLGMAFAPVEEEQFIGWIGIKKITSKTISDIEVRKIEIKEKLKTVVGIDPRLELQSELSSLEFEKRLIEGKIKDISRNSPISDSVAQQDWEKSLLDNQRKSIQSYMSAPYDSSLPKQIQMADVSGQGFPEIVRAAKDIRSIIDSSPKVITDVFRGVASKIEPQVGQVFDQMTFASWSRSAPIARGYGIANTTSDNLNTVVYHAKVPIVDVARLGPYGVEQKEVFVDKGFTFRVTKVERDLRLENCYDVELEIVKKK